MTDEQLMTMAISHHSAGRVAEAEAIYRRILAGNPNNAAALHMMGAVLAQRGERDAAIEYISRAIAIQPRAAEFHGNLALIYLEKGQPQKAADSARTALALKPNHPRALNHLGNALKMMGRIEESIDCLKSALAAQPDFVATLRSLADSYHKLGRDAEADSCIDRLLALRPTDLEALGARAEALFRRGRLAESGAVFEKIIAAHPTHWLGHHGLGVNLFELGQPDAAIPLLEKAVQIAPDRAGNYDSLGHAYTLAGRLDDAIKCLGKALVLDPNFTSAHNNLGHALAMSGRIDEAIASLQQALTLAPSAVDVHNNLGNAYCAKLDFERGMAAYDAALFYQADHADSHWNKAFLLLLQGDLERGWLEYEWRWVKFRSQKQNFMQPLWHGEDISGKTMLLHHEQGLGDTIQFIRFAALVAQRGARVIVRCPPPLSRLLSGQKGIDQVVGEKDALPPFDVHCPLMSLAWNYNVTLTTIPATTPYLLPDPVLAAYWREKLDQLRPGLKVGLAWAGSPVHRNDRTRSTTLQTLAPLAVAAGVQFISLQKGAPADQGKSPPQGMNFIDWTEALNDFAQTAALMSNLDLIITVDTSVAHLAGAIGKPVWTLIPHYPDWRWLMDRTDSPWYPTMRLFRQPGWGDWGAVIERVAEELTNLPEENP